jgi:metal-responsive CopG/Arc/MetJ family transcriptional regulator
LTGNKKLARHLKKDIKKILVEFDAPEDLVSEYDRIVMNELNYQSRAEALREHMRKLVMEYRPTQHRRGVL